MLEGRKSQFIEELMMTGLSKQKAKEEVEQSIDRLIYYAGWSDKFQQIFSSVNPVASHHFNFSVLEPMGVVSVISSNESALLGLVSTIAPIIVGGNTCVVLSSENNPMVSISFAEVLNTSDVPHGVVNILTGKRKELIHHFASHMDVNAVSYCGEHDEEIEELQKQIENEKIKNLFGEALVSEIKLSEENAKKMLYDCIDLISKSEKDRQEYHD